MPDSFDAAVIDAAQGDLDIRIDQGGFVNTKTVVLRGNVCAIIRSFTG